MTALRSRLAPIIAALITAISTPVYAASAGMPWEGPLNRLATSLTGPVARVVGILAIFGVGIGIAVSDGGSGIRKLLWVVLGLTIMFSAATWGIQFLGFGGGLLA